MSGTQSSEYGGHHRPQQSKSNPRIGWNDNWFWRTLTTLQVPTVGFTSLAIAGGRRPSTPSAKAIVIRKMQSRVGSPNN